MIHKQGAEYKESSEIEEAVLEESGSKKSHSPLIIVIALVLGILGIALALIFGKRITAQEAGEQGPSKSEGQGVVIGDDEYWNQFDDPISAFSYSDEEKQKLRAWGYTGDEIEKNEADKIPAQELIDDSRREQEKMRETLSNPTSPEYQALLNNTWLGQQSLVIPGYEEGITEGEIFYDTHTLNADYDKVPAHGHNLFLKVYLDDGSYVFMECPLLRYMQLSDSGNIVVQYQTATVKGITIVHDMKEVAVS